MLDSRSWSSAALGLFILTLALPAARGYSDPIPYQVQPVAGPGITFNSGRYSVPAGSPKNEVLRIDGLSDTGQLLFRVRGDYGSALVLDSGGHLTPIALSYGPAPGGSWPGNLVV